MNLTDQSHGFVYEPAGRVALGWLANVDQVVGNPAQDLAVGFRGTDVQAAIHECRIDTDNLDRRFFREADGPVAFARARRPG